MKAIGKQHFSHDHILSPLDKEEEDDEILCSACREAVSDELPMHGCSDCKFYLHESCLEAPRSMEHASHPLHPLTLQQTPTYPNRTYACDACGRGGTAFSYTCAHCEFDLHLLCATMPETITAEELHPHELTLVFETPARGSDRLVACGFCGADEKQSLWPLYCEACEFSVHVKCVYKKFVNKAGDSGEGESSSSSSDDDEEEEVMLLGSSDGDSGTSYFCGR